MRLLPTSVGNTRPAIRATTQQRRSMGGGQPVSRSMEAELWQGHPKQPEGWEGTIYFTYAATAVILALVGLAPDTSIQTVSICFCFVMAVFPVQFPNYLSFAICFAFP